jgi:hypothetical protein
MTSKCKLVARALVSFAVTALVAAGPADAQRGGGGGGGGRGGSGGGISRSGPAASGSFSGGGARASASARGGSRGDTARQSGQAATQQRESGTRTQGQAGEQAGANQAARQESTSAARESAASSRSQAQQERQQAASDAQNSRQEQASDLQEDRQDAWNDAAEDVDGVVVYGGEVHTIDDDDVGTAAAIAVGTAVTVGAMQRMTTPSSSGAPPACTMSEVPVGETTYYQCGPNWYEKAYVNGETSYVSVAPPPGH